MIFLPVVGFVLVALAAVAFIAVPLWRGRTKGGALLGAAIALFLLGVGGGTYWMLGRPGLAVRQAEGLHTRDVRALVPFLIQRVRKAPGDVTAWDYLGRVYMGVGDPGDAAKAYAQGLIAARRAGRPSAGLASAYGEALVAQAGGAVGDEAMGAFTEALSLNPKDAAARYFLGQGRAERGDRGGALALWDSLLADTPAASPLHQTLVDRIALLTAQGAGPSGAPDPRQMVAGLAARLKNDPNDAAGWQRLIRAYAVLGQPDDAKAALATARRTFAADRTVSAALDAEAKEMKLD